jgi:hypothetical protein
MATAERMRAPLEQPVEKGLKPGALGLVSTTVIATASVAPAYSIAATLVFVVGAVGLQAPAVTVLAFVPMLQVGGTFVIAVIVVLVGLACYIYCRITRPAFFRKQTLTRATPTLTPDPSLPEEAR